MAVKTIYSLSSVENLISDAIEMGYSMVQLREGVLGLGDIVLISPDDNYYNYVIREVVLNEWSSGQTVRRCRKISKALQEEIYRAENQLED